MHPGCNASKSTVNLQECAYRKQEHTKNSTPVQNTDTVPQSAVATLCKTLNALSGKCSRCFGAWNLAFLNPHIIGDDSGICSKP
eukprot:9101458-Karenia_brevis.AAC.1